MIIIIDYGVGNLGSIKNMIRKIGGTAETSADLEVIKNADKLILPGVGHFDYGMSQLKELGLIEVLNQHVLQSSKPFLGICLGMQLMALCSEEGDQPGLGWFNFNVKKFDAANHDIKVPHMGWNRVDVQQETPLLKGVTEESKYYFVHSFYVASNAENKAEELANTNYGHEFVSILGRDNVFGVQFHPEKSHKHGMNILNNFMSL